MNDLEMAINSLKQIVGYYRRSHKHGENTCYMMCLEAERTLRELSHLTPDAADGAIGSEEDGLFDVEWVDDKTIRLKPHR